MQTYDEADMLDEFLSKFSRIKQFSIGVARISIQKLHVK